MSNRRNFEVLKFYLKQQEEKVSGSENVGGAITLTSLPQSKLIFRQSQSSTLNTNTHLRPKVKIILRYVNMP